MLIISNKINELAVFIQRGINVGSNASPNWVSASWRVVRSKTLSPTRVSKSDRYLLTLACAMPSRAAASPMLWVAAMTDMIFNSRGFSCNLLIMRTHLYDFIYNII
jgi:hypothetical protein